MDNRLIYETFNKNIGKYAHGDINENGHILLEFSKRSDLRLTNTFFKHKAKHRMTWECPQRLTKHKNQEKLVEIPIETKLIILW